MKLFGRRAEPAQVGSGPSVGMLTVRVAMAASAIVGVAFVGIAIVVAVVVSNNMTSEIDRHLTAALDAQSGGLPGGLPDAGPGSHPGFDPGRQDPRGAPILFWKVSADGTPAGQGSPVVDLPVEDRSIGSPTTVAISGISYRIAGRDVGSQHFVVAQALNSVSDTVSTLIVAEFGIGCTLLIVVFLGALAIGRRVALPIERARRRQLEFTADASHELRTPLSVIEAHTSLALARKRDAAWDANAFGRIDSELRRTRRLVDDMLWLARFDSTGRQPNAEPVDVAVLAAQAADRFAAVVEARHQKLTVRTEAAGQTAAGAAAAVPTGSAAAGPTGPTTAAAGAAVVASPEWLDRLLGVLIDNAIKYSPEGGTIDVTVAAEGRRVRLTVDDSGRGIPEDERARVFDRFHRASDAPGGAGLGLAIGNAIVRATGGRWSIATSPAGGASISVSWPRAAGRS
jgi:signal transduction histidine kinase